MGTSTIGKLWPDESVACETVGVPAPAGRSENPIRPTVTKIAAATPLRIISRCIPFFFAMSATATARTPAPKANAYILNLSFSLQMEPLFSGLRGATRAAPAEAARPTFAANRLP